MKNVMNDVWWLHLCYRYEMLLEHVYMYDGLLEAIWWHGMNMKCKSMFMRKDEMKCTCEMMKMQSMLNDELLHATQKRKTWRENELMHWALAYD